MWLVSDDDEDDRGRVLRLCGTCVLVARVCSANCDLNSFHLPSCPLLSTLVPPFHYPPPSCALFALSSCPLSTLGKPYNDYNGYNGFNDYKDYNADNDYNDLIDYNDYNNYNDYRDSDLDLY